VLRFENRAGKKNQRWNFREHDRLERMMRGAIMRSVLKRIATPPNLCLIFSNGNKLCYFYMNVQYVAGFKICTSFSFGWIGLDVEWLNVLCSFSVSS
jgi:hypothetical protein